MTTRSASGNLRRGSCRRAVILSGVVVVALLLPRDVVGQTETAEWELVDTMIAELQSSPRGYLFAVTDSEVFRTRPPDIDWHRLPSDRLGAIDGQGVIRRISGDLIWRSDDNGDSWQPRGRLPQDAVSGGSIGLDGSVWTSDQNSIRRSFDDGFTWGSRIPLPSTNPGDYICDRVDALTVGPTGRFFAGCTRGVEHFIMVWKDLAHEWGPRMSVWTSNAVIGSVSILTTLEGLVATSTGFAPKLSVDEGRQWHDGWRCETTLGNYFLAPLGPLFCHNGYQRSDFERSDDGGESFSPALPGFPEVDLQNLVFVAGRIYAATSQGIFSHPLPQPEMKLSAPANESVDLPTTVWLEWDDVAFGSRYDVQVAQDSTFESLVFHDNVPLPNVRSHLPLEGGRYYWRVRAVRGAIKSPWSVPWSFSTSSPSQCPERDYALQFQAQVDAFPSGCSEIVGDLTIGGRADVGDVSNLLSLNSIGGSLVITSNSDLVSLDGLTNITSVGGKLQIEDNPSLTSLDGLQSLESVVDGIDIVHNASLTSLYGLTSLRGVSGELFRIEGNRSLKSLNGLTSLTSIGAQLWIVGNDSLFTLDGLSRITAIGEGLENRDGDVSFLKISDNPRLKHIRGLSGLTSNPHGLLIEDNSSLTGLRGLDGITSIGGELSINGNAELKSVSALWRLKTLGGGLSISRNPQLKSLDGLASLESVRNLFIFSNDRLEDLSSLSGISSIEISLWISNNASLASLDGMSGIVSIGGALEIVGNPILSDLAGLAQVTSVGGNLQIEHCPALAGLGGLNSIAFVGQDLIVKNNSALVDVDGLSSISSVGRSVTIEDNGNLENVDGLASIQSIGADRDGEGLSLRGNINLGQCSCGLYSCVSSDCVTGPVTMSGNDPDGDCNNDGADLVANACPVVDVEDTRIPSDLPTEFGLHPAYPNPFNPDVVATTIGYDLPEASHVELTVFDAPGRQVKSLVSGRKPAGRHVVVWIAEDVPSGAYFLRLEAGRFRSTRTIILWK